MKNVNIDVKLVQVVRMTTNEGTMEKEIAVVLIRFFEGCVIR